MPRALGRRTPVAGGIDVTLPGAGIRLGATRWPGAGPPIVLLHGLSSQRHFWDLVVPSLLGAPVVALDQRGHGDSESPDDSAPDFSQEAAADDVATALDALGLSRAVVVGHSWGASVALTFAARHAERALAVVAIDGGFTVPGDRELPREQLRQRMEPPRFALPPDELVGMLARGPLGPWWSEDLAAAVLPGFAVGDDGLARARLTFERHMRIVDTLLDFDPTALYAGVRCPVWLVSCEPLPTVERDARTVGWALRKEAGLQRATEALDAPRLQRWAGALHDVPLQWPALVAGLIGAAAQETRSARGAAAP
ncbi:MAG TPA: alpha/beta hydrolase [Mycobacteriales bacterium]|nr:alpha/beta hydrolase [Mycobacteriales bacterium]